MDHWENHPHYACDLIWGDDEGPNHLTPTLDTESMLPLLPTSSNELDDPVAQDLCKHNQKKTGFQNDTL